MFLRKMREVPVMPLIGDRSQNVQIMKNFNTKLAIQSKIGSLSGRPARAAGKRS